MLPKFVFIQQTNQAAPRIGDPYGVVRAQIQALGLSGERFQGKRIGITAGSRGIDRIPELVRAVADAVKDQGGQPVIFAAMGSHGGGTAQGQREMLASLGITEESVGAPVACCEDCRSLGETPSGFPVYYNALVEGFDGLIVLNRVKTHTDFSDETESGLFKMFAIGIGNPQGCRNVHALALSHGYGPVIREVAQAMMDRFPVLCGVMVTENWRSQLDSIRTALPQDFYAAETERLAYVKDHQVKLPVKACDVLLVGEIGKNISGAGMDTKVIGRMMVKGQKEPPYPNIGRIVVRSVTEASHGNAIGIGLADFTTRKVVEGIDLHAMALNAISSASPEQGRIPCVTETEEEALTAALTTLGYEPADFSKAKMIYIKNTGAMETMAVSQALFEELKDNPNIALLRPAEELRFSSDGELLNYQDVFWPEGQAL